MKKPKIKKPTKKEIEAYKKKAVAMAKKEIASAKKKLAVAEKKAIAYARKNPQKAMIIAAAIGSAIGAGLTAAFKKKR